MEGREDVRQGKEDSQSRVCHLTKYHRGNWGLIPWGVSGKLHEIHVSAWPYLRAKEAEYVYANFSL